MCDNKQIDESYKFLRLYYADFSNAFQVVDTISNYEEHKCSFKDKGIIITSLWTDVIMSYSRPFSGNKGVSKGKHRLNESDVPEIYHPLHKKIIDFRDQVFAHTDFEAKKASKDLNGPHVSKISLGGKIRLGMSFCVRHYKYKDDPNFDINEMKNLLTAMKDIVDTYCIEMQECYPKAFSD